MLEVKNLSVNYGKISALRNISFKVMENEVVALIGSNGAGKTTTLMSISGLVTITDGDILYKGDSLVKKSPYEIVRMKISHIPEGRHIFPRMSVEENLIMGIFGDKKANLSIRNSRIEEQYELFPRLKERRKQMGGSLSGGEQQMLAIARGLMCDPELVMFDEPSLGLAPILVGEIFELIIKIKKRGKTILLIEQNANIALQLSDRAYVLETGEIHLSGSGKEMLNNEEVKKAYLGI